MQLPVSAFLAAMFLFIGAAFSVAAPLAEAQLGPKGAVIEDAGGHVILRVDLSQPVPWSVRTMDGPPRIVVEFSTLHWDRPPEVRSGSIGAVNAGILTPEQSRLVAVLLEPLEVQAAEMRVADDGSAQLEISMFPTTAEAFRAEVTPDPRPEPPLSAPDPDRDSDKIRVAIDPGHGGLDPGAFVDGVSEADLVLSFALALKEELLRTDRFEVLLTREEDVFVPLEARMTLARAAGADVFLSLHADALAPEAGRASGLTVYTLSDDVVDDAALRIAERHSQQDILAGVDLSGVEDDLSVVLLDLARRETMPRSAALAERLVAGFDEVGLPVNSNPNRSGAFAVLKAAEWPSVLIELGFLSSDADRERLTSPEWTATAVAAIRESLTWWAEEDRTKRRGLRQ